MAGIWILLSRIVITYIAYNTENSWDMNPVSWVEGDEFSDWGNVDYWLLALASLAVLLAIFFCIYIIFMLRYAVQWGAERCFMWMCCSTNCSTQKGCCDGMCCLIGMHMTTRCRRPHEMDDEHWEEDACTLIDDIDTLVQHEKPQADPHAVLAYSTLV